MGSNRLQQTDDSAVEINLCVWHLRKVFADKRIMQRVDKGEFRVRSGPIKPRKNPPLGSSTAPYNQEFVVFDHASGEEIARCHQLLEADMKTLAASGKPDPKQVCIDGFNYHQLGNKNPDCPHCKAGISTYPEE